MLSTLKKLGRKAKSYATTTGLRQHKKKGCATNEAQCDYYATVFKKKKLSVAIDPCLICGNFVSSTSLRGNNGIRTTTSSVSFVDLSSALPRVRNI